MGFGKDMTGMAMSAGVFASNGRMRGLGIGGVGAMVKDINGVVLGGLINGASSEGWSFRVYTETTVGIQIGLLNFTRHLRGFQFGLLNYAGNNPKWAKLLPIMNIHL